MILGYDRPRPRRVNYEDFEQRLVSGLERLSAEGMGLLFWGSYEREDVDYGRSDIDSTWLMPGEFVLDKDLLGACSDILLEAQIGNHIPFDDVTVCDRGNLADGRFHTYTKDFALYFSREGRVVFGDDPRRLMRFPEKISGQMHNLAYNLRALRTSLLFFSYNQRFDRPALVKSFDSSLKKVSRMSKQLCDIVLGGVSSNRFSGLVMMRNIYPDIDPESVERIKALYDDHALLDAAYRNPEMMLSLMRSGTTMIEEQIRAYTRMIDPLEDRMVQFVLSRAR